MLVLVLVSVLGFVTLARPLMLPTLIRVGVRVRGTTSEASRFALSSQSLNDSVFVPSIWVNVRIGIVIR